MNKDLLAIFDNDGATADRYTVVFLDQRNCDHYECVGMNAAPFHPQGIYQHAICDLGAHLGRRIKFEELPEDCRRAVEQELEVV